MGNISNILKAVFTKSTQAATSTSKIPVLDSAGNPTGCDTMDTIASLLGGLNFKNGNATIAENIDELPGNFCAYNFYNINSNKLPSPYGMLIQMAVIQNAGKVQIWIDSNTTDVVIVKIRARYNNYWYKWTLFPGLSKGLSPYGIAYGTCSTTGTTAAKTATISNFLLLTNSMVSILFTNAVPAGATLNVSSTGAKPIWYHGAAIQDGEILAGTQAVLQYDGTHWNVVSKEEGRKGGYGQDWVDMGLPSGMLWAKKNIDITQPDHFAASEYQYECSFASWGNTFMHNPSSSSAFAYNWGGVNESEPYYQNQPYGSTPGNSIQTNLSRGNDVARVQLGAPWRLPSSAEFKELFDNSTLVDENGAAVTTSTPSVDSNARGENDKRVKVNNIVGLRLKSNINGNIVFFPASGNGDGSSWSSRGANGNYWSSSFSSARNAQYLLFYAGGVSPQSANSRYYGFAIRPVQ